MLPGPKMNTKKIKDMTEAINYFVFDTRTFTNVNEPEYTRWLAEEWNKCEPPMFSKVIGGIVHTAQAFYDGIVMKGCRLKPFSIYYIEGTKHKVRHFSKWITFKLHYENLLSILHEKEIHDSTVFPSTENETPVSAITLL